VASLGPRVLQFFSINRVGECDGNPNSNAQAFPQMRRRTVGPKASAAPVTAHTTLRAK